MRILVADDEFLARERLKRLLRLYDNFEVVGEACHGQEALEQANILNPDVLLLDISMPGMDGLETCRALMELPHPPAVIFCTAYDQHALEACQMAAVGYLLKPIKEQELVQSLQQATKLTQAQMTELDHASQESLPKKHRQHISAKTRKGLELIPIKSIRFFMADHKYVTVCFGIDLQEVIIDETLKELEAELKDEFVRIHRNALISVRFIEGVERNAQGQYLVKLTECPKKLTVSRRHVSSLKKLLQTL